MRSLVKSRVIAGNTRFLLPRCFSSTKTPTTTTPTTPTSSHDYPHYEIRQTRWNDNDGFGHINNSIYYNYMDDAINIHLIQRGIGRDYPRFIAENGIQFVRPISFPASIKVGLQVVKLGSSSVTYDVGFFEHSNADTADHSSSTTTATTTATANIDVLAARGKFVHVYMNETTGRPTAIPEKARHVLEQLMVVMPKDDNDNDNQDK